MITKPTSHIIHLSRVLLYILALIILYFLTLTPLSSESICYWYNRYTILCPMCGGTRSLLHFITLNFKEALTYNAVLTIGLYPAALILALQDSWAILANSFFHKHYTSWLLHLMHLINTKVLYRMFLIVIVILYLIWGFLRNFF